VSQGLAIDAKVKEAKEALDLYVREIVEWHFDPETGSPFWLEFAGKLDFNPRNDIKVFEDLRRFPPFEDEWLRGGAGSPLGAQGLRRSSHLCFRNRRHHWDPEKSDRHR